MKFSEEDVKEAAKNGVRYKTFYMRVYHGWTVKAAKSVPNTATKTTYWRKVAEKNGISRNTFYSRVNILFWDYEKAATKPSNRKKGNE